MNIDVILWVLGIAVMVLAGLFGFLVNRGNRQDERMNKLDEKLAQHARHTAENYVRGHEIAEVKSAVSALRTEMTTAVGELRTEITHQVSELTKAVYQMMGQQNSK